MAGHIVYAGKMRGHFLKKLFELIFRDEYQRLITVERMHVVPW
jgi:hypothetical protein